MIYQHLFAEMNHLLDEIAVLYPDAHGEDHERLLKQWNLLKDMSDGIIEEWLCFEEKMGYIRQNFHPSNSHSQQYPELKCGAFVKGQGYYHLFMFSPALRQFKLVTDQYPDSIIAHTYLAMCHVKVNEISEARSTFWSILERTRSKRLRSIVYNALGCIEATEGCKQKAEEYFKLAHHHDPSLDLPMANLEACKSCSGELQYGCELL